MHLQQHHHHTYKHMPQLLAILFAFSLHIHSSQSQFNETFAPNVTDEMEMSSTMLYTSTEFVEPTISPTTTSSAPPPDTTHADTTKAPRFTLVATFALSLQDSNATVEQLRVIIREVVEEQLDENAYIVSISSPEFAAVDDDGDADDTPSRRRRRRLLLRLRRLLAEYSAEFEVVIGVDDEDSAVVLAQTFESDEFKQELATVVSDEYGGTVTVTESSAEITSGGDDDEAPVVWQPWTYGDSLIHWILFALAMLVLLVCLVLLVYCCCKCRGGSAQRRKSRHNADDALFTPAKKADEKHEAAFSSDLKTAIEMHKRSSWLRKDSTKKLAKATTTSNESLDLNPTDVGTAFDMNFDSPQTSAASDAAAAGEDDAKAAEVETKGKSDDKKKETTKDAAAKKRKLSDKSDSTPGGPGDEEEEEIVPPPPQPPVNMQQMKDEELL